MKRFLIIGLGRFGMSLAETLFLEGAEVIAIDENMDRVEAIKDRVSHAVQLDSTDPDSLRSVGADRVDAAIIAIGENFEASVVTTAILKELGLKEIVVRAYTERERKILELIGASRVIFVEDEMGRRLGKAISKHAILDYVELSPTHSLVQWEIQESLVGSSPADLGLAEEWGLDLLAVKKRDEASSIKVGWEKEKWSLKFHPSPQDRFEKGEILILVGRNRDLHRFIEEASRRA